MSTPQPPDQPAYTPLPPPQKSRGSVLPGVLIGVLVFALIAGGAFAVVGLRDNNASGATSSSGSGKGPAPSPAPQGDMPKTDPALAAFYDQKLDWTKCSGRNECATMKVPLDYADPKGRSIDVKMLKVPATGKRVGALVVNPGGPGGSGIDYASAGASAWPAPILQHFDLVGFDPRGVGKSTPLKCLDTAQTDAFVAADPEPSDEAGRTQLAEALKGFGDACLQNSGDLTKHMSTLEVAKDMDVLRQLLGESKLLYFGASYGTSIGAQYAGLFPTHVGRMVLDGAIDQSLTNEQLNLGQAGGFETAWEAYAKDCTSGDSGSCPLGSSVAEATTKIRAFLAELEKQPLSTSDANRPLTSGNALLGVFLPLYVKSYWPLLTQALTQAMQNDNGTPLMTLSDAYTSRGPSGYKSNELAALYAVNCLDDDESVPVDQVPTYFPEFLKASPAFGETFAYSLTTCNKWPVRSGQKPDVVSAKGAPPIVVVGTTRDPATPYKWAKALADQLDSGVFVSRDGDGHTGFNQGNSCVDGAVENYLIADKVPKNGLQC
jgi:pimeloyl-ACP methyl ester carboxylesterase